MNFSFYPCFEKLNQFQNIWVYSDTHFGDTETQAKRHITDEQQIANINAKVGKKDVLIILGDVGTNDPAKWGYVRECVAKLRGGYKILIKGNHDIGTDFYQRHHAGERIDDHLFDEVYTGMVMLNDKILLSHEPISTPFTYNIHGHDHAVSKEPKNSFNACAEAIYYVPVSLLALLKDGRFAHVPSIHRTTIDKAIDRKQKRENTFKPKGRDNLFGGK